MSLSNVKLQQIFNRKNATSNIIQYQKRLVRVVQKQIRVALLPPASGGTGVLERPGIDLSPGQSEPQTEFGVDKGSTDRNKTPGGGDYRVLLLDNPKHTEKLVVQVITTVISGTGEAHAKNCFHTARQLGMAIICTCLKEHAEFYVEQICRLGCSASMEPDSNVL
eukprot:TRINITY_DN13402_c0_g1_i1.p2 TRINITY_DN13402_c0_g1~~TRINITY_DN13402_c0_g1_i1.p2  ORF type:complete len:191 (-),score=17.79 TRINITY_DN13402_c0_g1_i1:360-854(-)